MSVRGAGRAARELDDLSRVVQDELRDEVRGLGRYAERAFRDAAPGDTGSLAEAIRAVPYLRVARPRVTIRVEGWQGHRAVGSEGSHATVLDETFDDWQVTRTGHRVSRIHPVSASVLKVNIEGHRNPHAAVYRMHVRGSKPLTDWVGAAEVAVAGAAARSSANLSRRFEAHRVRA